MISYSLFFILIPVVFFAIAIILNAKKTHRNHIEFENSIQSAITNRTSLNTDWDQYYEYFLALGFSRVEITTVKEAIQQYSDVAKVMILPNDDLYGDLKIDSITEDDDNIAFSISEKLKLQDYQEGELIDNDVSTVEDLFYFIERKKQIDTNKTFI